jgi:hypothetical protein
MVILTHNKSLRSSLAVLEYPDLELEAYWRTARVYLIESDGPVEESPCLLTAARDGRYSELQKKLFFTYHLASWSKYGRLPLLSVPSAKAADGDLVISHLCGNGPRCAKPEHLKIEPKRVNDERAHCHYCLRNALARQGCKVIKNLISLGICPHRPPCFTLHNEE